jgi:PPOX class probable F420-dependent enzyme
MEIGEVLAPGTENGLQVGTRRHGTLGDLPATHIELLKGPFTAVMSTVNKSGSVQLTPVWLTDDGEHILVNSARGRLKDRNLRARPQVTVLVMNPENPFQWMSIQGEVVRIVDEDDPENGHLATSNIDAAAKLYMDSDVYPARDPRGEVRSLYFIRPDRVMTLGQA